MPAIVHPLAGLEERDGDLRLPPQQYLKLSLFAQLKKKPDLEKFPGTLVIRRYRKGEFVIYQGEAGWTAFYILTLEDLLTLRQIQLESTVRENERRFLMLEIERLKAEVKIDADLGDDAPQRQAATVHIATLGTKYSQLQTTTRLATFKSRPFENLKNRTGDSIYAPVGGLQTVSYTMDTAPLFEGDLFGEMSCLYRTPRSATVKADRDCYMVEFLRSVLEKVQKDTAFETKANGIILHRFLGSQLPKMAIFRDLKKEEYADLKNNVELISYDPGDIICDEHERSDCMYLVRNGLVKVMKNVSQMLSLNDIADWSIFGAALKKSSTETGTPHAAFWALLSDRARTIIQQAADPARLGTPDRIEIVFAINDVIRDEAIVNKKTNQFEKYKMADAPELKPIVDSEPFKAKLGPYPAASKAWSDAQVRRRNRLVVETLFQKGIRQHDRFAGVETILSYITPNDFFGEMGLLLNQPRTASCIAFSHPNQEGSVDLVKIPSKTFWRLMRASTEIRDKLKAEVANRRKQMLTTIARPVWEEANQVQFSERFSDLGLIQGQKLMLIDLDRCTRCDECVKACVHTHTDGRTRLFLDGPRFGKYLVPTACRSCLDPVCMINCPVASIHRGDNKEIVIENWCIGCEACAKDCPYGSIQMHDLGIVTEGARNWRYLPASAKEAQGEWFKPDYRDAKWLPGSSPFSWDRNVMAAVRDRLPSMTESGKLTEQAILFRCTFEMGRRAADPSATFRIELVSLSTAVRVWINGKELTVDDKPRRGKHDFSIPPLPKKPPRPSQVAAAKDAKQPEEPVMQAALAEPVTNWVRVGKNVVAISVMPTMNINEMLMQFRLDEIKKPKALPSEVEQAVVEEVVEKLVTHRAVVCDLCSSLPGQIPACVHACPHDAAMRVDARRNFPTRY